MQASSGSAVQASCADTVPPAPALALEQSGAVSEHTHAATLAMPSGTESSAQPKAPLQQQQEQAAPQGQQGQQQGLPALALSTRSSIASTSSSCAARPSRSSGTGAAAGYGMLLREFGDSASSSPRPGTPNRQSSKPVPAELAAGATGSCEAADTLSVCSSSSSLEVGCAIGAQQGGGAREL